MKNKDQIIQKILAEKWTLHLRYLRDRFDCNIQIEDYNVTVLGQRSRQTETLKFCYEQALKFKDSKKNRSFTCPEKKL